MGFRRFRVLEFPASHPLHEFHRTLPYDNRHRHNTDMGIREKKKLKHLLVWGEAKSDRTVTDTGRERVNSGGSPVRPVPHVVTDGGRDRGGNDDESNSNWKSTTSAAAKLLLRGVKDSAAAFGPLQSVAGALCFILDNCEVRPPPAYVSHVTYRCPRKRRRTSER